MHPLASCNSIHMYNPYQSRPPFNRVKMSFTRGKENIPFGATSAWPKAGLTKQGRTWCATTTRSDVAAALSHGAEPQVLPSR